MPPLFQIRVAKKAAFGSDSDIAGYRDFQRIVKTASMSLTD